MIQIVGSVRYEWSEVHQNKFEYLTVDCQCYDRLILDHITYSIFEITWDCIRIHCRFQVIVIVCELLNTQFVEVQLIMTGRGWRQVQGWTAWAGRKTRSVENHDKVPVTQRNRTKEGYWQYGSILKVVDFTSGTFQTSHYWAEVAQPGQRDRWIQRLKMRVQQWKFKVRGCVELSGKEGEGERERIPIQYDCFFNRGYSFELAAWDVHVHPSRPPSIDPPTSCWMCSCLRACALLVVKA
jgi:hypothetical protein